jgi:hypothetical protein
MASVLKQELALAVLSIHKDVIADTSRFNQKVIRVVCISEKSKKTISLT